MDISEDNPLTLFSQCGPIEDVTPVISKAGIATGDFVLQVTVTCKNFLDTLICQGTKHLGHHQRMESS